MRLDVQGASTIRRLIPGAILIFLTASSEAELPERLHRRRGDTPEQIEQRVVVAQEELKRCLDSTISSPTAMANWTGQQMPCSRSSAEHCRVEPRVVTL